MTRVGDPRHPRLAVVPHWSDCESITDAPPDAISRQTNFPVSKSPETNERSTAPVRLTTSSRSPPASFVQFHHTSGVGKKLTPREIGQSSGSTATPVRAARNHAPHKPEARSAAAGTDGHARRSRNFGNGLGQDGQRQGEHKDAKNEVTISSNAGHGGGCAFPYATRKSHSAAIVGKERGMSHSDVASKRTGFFIF